MQSPATYRVAVGLTAALASLALAAPALASGPSVESATVVVNANGTYTWTVTVDGLTPGDYLAFGAGPASTSVDFLVTTTGTREVTHIGPPNDGNAWQFSFTSAAGNQHGTSVTDSLFQVAETASSSLSQGDTQGALFSNFAAVVGLPGASFSSPEIESASYVVNANGTLDWTFVLAGLTPGDLIAFGAGSSASSIAFLASPAGHQELMEVPEPGADGLWTISFTSAAGNAVNQLATDQYVQVGEAPPNGDSEPDYSNIYTIVPPSTGQLPEVPWAAGLPVVGAGVGLWAARRRQRARTGRPSAESV
jgi:hypothetical protein